MFNVSVGFVFDLVMGQIDHSDLRMASSDLLAARMTGEGGGSVQNIDQREGWRGKAELIPRYSFAWME